jgi:hypothetical protein
MKPATKATIFTALICTVVPAVTYWCGIHEVACRQIAVGASVLSAVGLI